MKLDASGLISYLVEIMQSQRDSRVIIDVVRYEREIGQEAPPAISRSEVLEAVIAQGVSQWKFLGTGGWLLCITLHHLELKEALFMPRAQIKSYINSSFTLWPPVSYLLPAVFSTHISQKKQLFFRCKWVSVSREKLTQGSQICSNSTPAY